MKKTTNKIAATAMFAVFGALSVFTTATFGAMLLAKAEALELAV